MQELIPAKQTRNLKQTFLYRLFAHSKTGFAVVLIFLVIYALLFSKKMDMVFFPYNSMFSIDFTKTNRSSTYGMKINDQLVHLTGKPFWKKDFLEASLFSFSKYHKNGQRLYLHEYLATKELRGIFFQNLLPSKKSVANWPLWFAGFAGHEYSLPARFEIIQYDFFYNEGQAILTDSVAIYLNEFK